MSVSENNQTDGYFAMNGNRKKSEQPRAGFCKAKLLRRKT
jgi:hypothetical protein